MAEFKDFIPTGSPKGAQGSGRVVDFVPGKPEPKVEEKPVETVKPLVVKKNKK